MSELTGVAESPVAAGFSRAAAVADVPTGWTLKVAVGGREIALANREGTFYAVDNSCTHAGAPLGDSKLRGDSRLKQDCLLECPWHNSQFDIRTGEVFQGPARKPLRTYETQVLDGLVFIRVE